MDVFLHSRAVLAGVVRAIQIVERALEKYGRGLCAHEIVHNKYVVEA